MQKEPIYLGRETEQLEFKKSTGELKEGVISIVAILNKHQKGRLCFGVKNDGTVVGQEIGEGTLRSISQAIREHIIPPIHPVIQTVQYGDREVIQVDFTGENTPYLAYNIPRIRDADEDLVMEIPVYEKMLLDRTDMNNAWEAKVSDYQINDVSAVILNEYLVRAKAASRFDPGTSDPAIVLEKLKLLQDGHLLNAGAALFVDESDINELRLATFAEDDRQTFTDTQWLTGSILRLIKEAERYVITGTHRRSEFNGDLTRKDIPEIPPEALREAIINAFAHRVIESRQGVEVFIYKSFVDITSPGKFPEGLSPEMFFDNTRSTHRRNPRLTRTLYFSQNMECIATGLKRIKDACDKAGCKFGFLQNDYTFTVRFYRHCGEGWGAYENKSVPTTKPPQAISAGNNTSGDKLVALISENEKITREALAKELGISVRSVQRIINKLGNIHYDGVGIHGHWVIDGPETSNC